MCSVILLLPLFQCISKQTISLKLDYILESEPFLYFLGTYPCIFINKMYMLHQIARRFCWALNNKLPPQSSLVPSN